MEKFNRDFKAEQPNKKWVTDVAEFSLFGEKFYLSPILDLYNGEIISYSLQRRPTFDLITTMLDDAIKLLPASSSVILHSDQGWQYQMKKYQKILKDNNITQSMSRKGNCLDNSLRVSTKSALFFYASKSGKI